jgi:hypothetical protein
MHCNLFLIGLGKDQTRDQVDLSTTLNQSQLSRNKTLGKLVHLGFDALLISAFLASVKRATGITCMSLEPSETDLVFDDITVESWMWRCSSILRVHLSCALAGAKQGRPS